MLVPTSFIVILDFLILLPLKFFVRSTRKLLHLKSLLILLNYVKVQSELTEKKKISLDVVKINSLLSIHIVTTIDKNA